MGSRFRSLQTHPDAKDSCVDPMEGPAATVRSRTSELDADASASVSRVGIAETLTSPREGCSYPVDSRVSQALTLTRTTCSRTRQGRTRTRTTCSGANQGRTDVRMACSHTSAVVSWTRTIDSRARLRDSRASRGRTRAGTTYSCTSQGRAAARAGVRRRMSHLFAMLRQTFWRPLRLTK